MGGGGGGGGGNDKNDHVMGITLLAQYPRKRLTFGIIFGAIIPRKA